MSAKIVETWEPGADASRILWEPEADNCRGSFILTKIANEKAMEVVSSALLPYITTHGVQYAMSM